MFERFLTVSTQTRTSLRSHVTHQRMKRQRKTSRASSHVLYSSLFILVFVLASILTVGVNVSGASEHSRIEGNVRDQANAKVAGARVTLRATAGVTQYETRSDEDGQFSISNVPDGNYRVTVESPGFTQTHEVRVELRAGVTTTVDVRLDVAAITDQLVITATRTETASSELGGSVSVTTSEDLKRGNQSLISEALR